MKLRAALLGAAAVGLALQVVPAHADKADDTLTWATDKEIDVALPFYNNIRETVTLTRNVWDGLLYRNPETFEYEPLLSTEYRWVDDKTLEFKLREGVVFHDGSTFDADDAVTTLNNVSNPDFGAVTQNYVDWIDHAEKVDDMTIRIIAKEPFPAALEMLAGPIAMLPEEIWETAETDATGKPDYGTIDEIGTGPYKIVEAIPGERVVMEANEDYFDGPKPAAGIKNLVFRSIPDPETQIAELITGGINWIWDVPKEKAEDMKGMPGITVVNAPTMRFSYLGMDRTGRSGDTPFTDQKVRQAVYHAIDREAIARELVGGASKVIHSVCYPSQFGCTDDVPKYDYDPEKAKQLLEEAGYADGFTTDIYAYRERPYTEAVMNYLSQVGIKTNLKFMQYRALREMVWEDETPLYNMTWGSSSVNDVSASTSVFFKGDRDDYCRDETVIENLEKGDTSVDPEVRREAYKTALARIAEQACWVPLFTYSKNYAFSDQLDFTPTDDEIPEFYRATWKE